MRRTGIMIFLVCCLASNAWAQVIDQSAARRGAYLAKLGDCTSCHTAPGKPEFSGGFPLHIPIGVIYGSNITPDKTYGIGNYTLNDFKRALREGVARDGHHLYPAMPYPSFAALSDQDIADLYAYFMQDVAPVRQPPPQTDLVFPFNQRWGLALWNIAFANQDRFAPKPEHDARWNRGAYLVRGIAHCGACHTPRGVAYEEKAYSETSPLYLTGALADNWFAANLSEAPASGLGRWSEADIAAFLKTGHGANAASMGNMTQAIENSTQYMTDEDRQAIAHYLKSLAAPREAVSYQPDKMQSSPVSEHPGAGLYQSACASCHGRSGEGRLPRIPALAGNAVVLTGDPTSLIRLVLQGGKTAQTQTKTGVAGMPSFARWTNQEIADAISYIRSQWGNHAPAATTHEVMMLRKAIQKQ